MGYRKAEDILPVEVIRIIQQYVDGESIYIPRLEKTRKEWGSNTQIKQELQTRNQAIYEEYLKGCGIGALAKKYYLSDKSIQRIILQCKRTALT